MKPVLTVEGKQLKVLTVEFVDSVVRNVYAIDEENNVKSYYDITADVSLFTEKPEQINLSECLTWQNDKAIERIKSQIEHYEQSMKDLEAELMAEYRRVKTAPFTSDEMAKIEEQHKAFNNIVLGLDEALGLILLNGGEVNES